MAWHNVTPCALLCRLLLVWSLHQAVRGSPSSVFGAHPLGAYAPPNQDIQLSVEVSGLTDGHDLFIDVGTLAALTDVGDVLRSRYTLRTVADAQGFPAP